MNSVALQRTELPSAKALVGQTRTYAKEKVATSWFVLVSTFACLGGTAAIAATATLPWPVRLSASLVEGLVIVRAFILYHDHQHGALLRKSVVARALTSSIGFLVMAPPRVWKQTHDYHHA